MMRLLAVLSLCVGLARAKEHVENVIVADEAKRLIHAGSWKELKARALESIASDPDNLRSYEYLARAARGLGDEDTARRALLSLLEIAPRNPAVLARTGYLLLAEKQASVAIDIFNRAISERQSDPNVHRGLALAYWLNGNPGLAAEALEAALGRDFNARYGDVKRVLREELAYIYREWLRREPSKRTEMTSRASRRGVDMGHADALRITLSWDTDANDVDLHVIDPRGEKCFYQHKQTLSGLQLYSDQTQGLGPEVIRTDRTVPGKYWIQAQYYNIGVMAESRGVVVILRPGSEGNVTPEIRTFTLESQNGQILEIASVDF